MVNAYRFFFLRSCEMTATNPKRNVNLLLNSAVREILVDSLALQEKSMDLIPCIGFLLFEKEKKREKEVKDKKEYERGRGEK